jgi:RNA polymerase sigma factor (sigma-70 family)
LSQPITAYSEEQLLLLLKQKSEVGFSYLYSSYAAVLFGTIKRIIADEETANDVLQEVFVKIWNNIDQYDPAKARIYTWMMNISRNAAIDKLRSRGEIMKSKIRTGEAIVSAMEQQSGRAQPIDAIGLRGHVENLKPEYKVIVNLSYFGGFTMEEIAEQLNIPLGTVKTRMRSALQQLRKIYKETE